MTAPRPRDAAGRIDPGAEPGATPASSPAPTLRHRLEYAAVRAFAGAVRVLGVRGGTALAGALARLYCLVDRRHVRVAETNLRQRLGLDGGAASRVARASFRHLFVCAVEMLHFEREIARRGLDDVIEVEGAECVDQALARGRGAVVVTGHLGNWETAARVFGVRGWRTTTVYRPLDNPLLDRWVRELRSAHGQTVVPKSGAVRQLLRALRDNGVAVLLVDQDARSQGLLVPFLGVPASTIPTPAELALRTGAAIIPIVPRRTGPGFRHQLRFGPPVEVAATGDHPADVLRIMTEINRRLEAALRQAPEQWLWAHRRWKSSPRAETPA